MMMLEKDKDPKSLLEWLASLEPIDNDFPEIEDPPPEPFDFDFKIEEDEKEQ